MYKLGLIFLLLLASHASAFDHEYRNYADVLKHCVKEGRVDYAVLQKNRTGIDDFVKQLSLVQEGEYSRWSRDQQLAFWINAYNGWFLQIVIDRYPIKRTRFIGFIFPDNSVQQIGGIWDDIKTRAAGREVSLSTIEHKILRPMFKEPRIHFSIVCASVGCPALRDEPYWPAALGSQLESSAKNFINNPAKVQLDPHKDTIEISRIFKWFSEDFDGFAIEPWSKIYPKDEAGPIALISKYLSPKDASFLRNHRVSVEYFAYDWTLNENKR